MNDLQIQINDDLVLRSWKIGDADELFHLINTNRDHLSAWLPWVPSVKEVKDSENFITTSLENFKAAKGLELGIFYKDVLVGCIGLHELNTLHHKTSIGYWLGSQSQGKGLMTLAVQALIDYSFLTYNFNRVEIRAATENKKSRAIPERLGFVQEGTLRQAEFVENRYLDIVVYSVIKKDWEQRQELE